MGNSLQFSREWLDKELLLRISGQLDESANFNPILLSMPMNLCINTRYLSRASSAGIRLWLLFIERAQEAGVKLRLVECAICLTNHFKMILGARNRNLVESVMGGFMCKSCRQSFEQVIRTPDILTVKDQITRQCCPACGSPASFDEIASDYFAFLA